MEHVLKDFIKIESLCRGTRYNNIHEKFPTNTQLTRNITCISIVQDLLKSFVRPLQQYVHVCSHMRETNILTCASTTPRWKKNWEILSFRLIPDFIVRSDLIWDKIRNQTEGKNFPVFLPSGDRKSVV